MGGNKHPIFRGHEYSLRKFLPLVSFSPIVFRAWWKYPGLHTHPAGQEAVVPTAVFPPLPPVAFPSRPITEACRDHLFYLLLSLHHFPIPLAPSSVSLPSHALQMSSMECSMLLGDTHSRTPVKDPVSAFFENALSPSLSPGDVTM
jgi:hypothetical protein